MGGNWFLSPKIIYKVKKVSKEWSFVGSQYVSGIWFDEDKEIDKFSMFIDGNRVELIGNIESIFMELSKILKDKYEIHSCYTCKYGNFCPTGDIDTEIFCVNDFEPKCKSDLYFVTEDREERKKRSRTLFDVCESFQPCSDDYYTYK